MADNNGTIDNTMGLQSSNSGVSQCNELMIILQVGVTMPLMLIMAEAF